MIKAHELIIRWTVTVFEQAAAITGISLPARTPHPSEEPAALQDRQRLRRLRHTPAAIDDTVSAVQHHPHGSRRPPRAGGSPGGLALVDVTGVPEMIDQPDRYLVIRIPDPDPVRARGQDVRNRLFRKDHRDQTWQEFSDQFHRICIAD